MSRLRARFFYQTAFFVLLGFCSGKGHGFEVFPEYQSLTFEQANDFSGLSSMDSEYQSDVLAFSQPLRWQRIFNQRSNVFDTTTGSISSDRFLFESRLKLEQDALQNTKFKIIYFQQGDYEYRSRHLIFEIEHLLFNGLSLSLYGEPETDKDEDDIGLASTFHWSDSHHLRLFYTATNFSKNNRNEQSDRYRVMPKSYGFKWWKGHSDLQRAYYELNVRHDQHSIWEFPDDVYQLKYQKWYSDFFYDQPIDYEHRLMIRLSYEVSDQSKEYLDPLRVNGNTIAEKEKVGLLMQYQLPSPIQNHRGDDILLGLNMTDRRWHINSQQIRQTTILPHINYYWNMGGDSQPRYHPRYLWWIGIEVSFYNGSGPDLLRASTDKDRAIEGRSNIGYRIDFNEKTTFDLLFTFDLDRFGSGETWEGGGASLQMLL